MTSNAPPVPSGLAVVIANDDDNGNPQPLDLAPITDPQFSYISGVAFQIDWRDIEPFRPPSQVGKDQEDPPWDDPIGLESMR